MNMINTAPALSETDQLRADIYALLAALLRQAPAEELLTWLAGIEPDEDEDTPMARAWKALALSARYSKPEQLDDEFHHLFIGVGRGELMPFGCWYLTGSLMEKPLVVLRADLARLGYERQPDVKEPEDHIAALCEVMSMLIANGYDARMQQQFWQAHLRNWATQFFTDLQNAEHAVLYTAVGLLGAAFMQQEAIGFDRLPPAAAECGQQ